MKIKEKKKKRKNYHLMLIYTTVRLFGIFGKP